MDKYKRVRQLRLQREPKVKLKDALERFDMANTTYYRLKDLMDPKVKKKPLRLWTCFWGDRHLELFESALVRSLSWSLNKDAISHAKWDIWTLESEFAAVADIAKEVGIGIELHAADSFLAELESKYLKDPGIMQLEMFKMSIKRCLETDSQMLIAPPDTIFGGDSLANILQAGEQPATVVFVVHIRVLSSILRELGGQINRFGPASSVSNARLVSLAMKNAHKSFEEAQAGLERINSYIGGIFWKKRPNGVFSVQHQLPTPYLINWQKVDLDFFSRDNGPGNWPQVFGQLDHEFPSATIFPLERARVIGSSDDAFICEITGEKSNVPALMNYEQSNPDRFWRGALHNSILKQFCVTLRGES
jgi:ACT domain-containing protein